MKYSELEHVEGESSGQKLSEDEAPEDCMQNSKRGGWKTFPYIIGIIRNLFLCLANLTSLTMNHMYLWFFGRISTKNFIILQSSHTQFCRVWGLMTYAHYLLTYELKNAGTELGLSLAATGWGCNLTVYLITVFNFKSIHATQISSIVAGSSNLFPIAGAILADSFFGSFSVISIFSMISLLVKIKCSLNIIFIVFYSWNYLTCRNTINI